MESPDAARRDRLKERKFAKAWLLIFDQRPGLTWEERLTVEDVEIDGKRVHVRGG